ncbi:hypothetical protein FRC03_006763 [Tulasnella sp. 419]|nr:hypothetical protein FRC03_006763 [Tulasnella sp. 419]
MCFTVIERLDIQHLANAASRDQLWLFFHVVGMDVSSKKWEDDDELSIWGIQPEPYLHPTVHIHILDS